MNNKIYELTDDFDFNLVRLENPSLISGNNYYSKINNTMKNNLYIQLPKCNTKQGIVNTNNKCFCDLEFFSNNKQVIEFFENLENHCIKEICKNKDLWFYDARNISDEDIQEYVVPIMRSYKSGKKFLIKTSIKQDKIIIYDENEKKVILEEYDNNNEIVPLININGIKFSKSSFIIDIMLVQFMVLYPSDSFENQILIKLSKPLNKLENSKTSNTNNSANNSAHNSAHNSANNSANNNINNSPNNNTNNSPNKYNYDDTSSINDDDTNSIEDSNAINDDDVNSINDDDTNSINDEDVNSIIDIGANVIIDEVAIKDSDPINIQTNNNSNEQSLFSKNNNTNNVNNTNNTNNTNNVNNTNNTNYDKNSNSIIIKSDALENNPVIEICDLDNMTIDSEPIELKTHDTIYLEIYKKAKQKAKEIRKNAIQAFLEAKNIKVKYNLNTLDDSSSDEEFK